MLPSLYLGLPANMNPKSLAGADLWMHLTRGDIVSCYLPVTRSTRASLITGVPEVLIQPLHRQRVRGHGSFFPSR
jgi:hypothetical protein